MKFSKNVTNKKHAHILIFFNEKKIRHFSIDRWLLIFYYEKVLISTQLSYHLMQKMLKIIKWYLILSSCTKTLFTFSKVPHICLWMYFLGRNLLIYEILFLRNSKQVTAKELGELNSEGTFIYICVFEWCQSYQLSTKYVHRNNRGPVYLITATDICSTFFKNSQFW